MFIWRASPKTLSFGPGGEPPDTAAPPLHPGYSTARQSRNQTERGQPCPRVSFPPRILADEAVRAPKKSSRSWAILTDYNRPTRCGSSNRRVRARCLQTVKPCPVGRVPPRGVGTVTYPGAAFGETSRSARLRGREPRQNPINTRLQPGELATQNVRNCFNSFPSSRPPGHFPGNCVTRPLPLPPSFLAEKWGRKKTISTGVRAAVLEGGRGR